MLLLATSVWAQRSDYVASYELQPSIAPGDDESPPPLFDPPIKAVLALPFTDNDHVRNPFGLTINVTKPVIAVAMDHVYRQRKLLAPGSIRWNYLDTNSSDLDAPYNVIEQYKKNQMDVLFGFCYAYALAPVARLAWRWNSGMPVVTTCGMESHFRRKGDEYRSLTRVTTLVYDLIGEMIHDTHSDAAGNY
jgi:hypothetical protein